MEIRNNADALKSLLNVPSSAGTAAQPARHGNAGPVESALSGDQATVSQVGAEVSQTTEQDSVRGDKVAAIQQAIAAGTYSVSATKVADKMIDAMLAGGLDSTK